MLSGRPAPDLLVLSAPALDDGLPRWQHILAPLIARILPTLALKNAWGPDVLSRDPEVGRLALLDPGSPERMTTRLGAFGFAAQERVRARLATLAVPTLVFHGSDDRLVPPTATEPFEGIPGVTRRMYPGFRHETLNEPEGPQIVADVIGWLREAVDRRPGCRGRSLGGVTGSGGQRVSGFPIGRVDVRDVRLRSVRIREWRTRRTS